LPAVLRSLALQGVPAELAVLDASNDPRVAEAVAAAGLSLAYHREGPDGCQTEAIDEGWRNTCSPFVTWLNADDILMPGALLVLLDALEEEEADVAFGESTILDEQGATIGLHGQVTDVDDLLYRSNCISQPSALVRRAAVDAVDAVGGLDTSLHYTMDWDLWQRLYANKARFHRLDGVYSAVFWGDCTKTSKIIPQRLAELFRLTARYAGHFAAAKTVLSAALQAKSLTRTACETGCGLFFAADRTPRETGKAQLAIPVINVGAVLASTLEIYWTSDKLEPTAEGHAEEIYADRSIAQIRLDRPVPTARTEMLVIREDLAATPRFLRLEFTRGWSSGVNRRQSHGFRYGWHRPQNLPSLSRG